MKRLITLILLPALLAIGGCASTPARMETRYVIGPDGNIQTQQQYIPAESDNRLLETVAIVGLGIVGLYFVGEVFDVWDKDEKSDPAPAAPSNPLVPTGGQTSWTTDYIQPVYQPVNQPTQYPVSFAE